jgi:hypothetical protein
MELSPTMRTTTSNSEFIIVITNIMISQKLIRRPCPCPNPKKFLHPARTPEYQQSRENRRITKTLSSRPTHGTGSTVAEFRCYQTRLTKPTKKTSLTATDSPTQIQTERPNPDTKKNYSCCGHLRGIVVDGVAEVEIERPVGPYQHITRRLLHNRRRRHLAPIVLSSSSSSSQPQQFLSLSSYSLFNLLSTTLQNNFTDHTQNSLFSNNKLTISIR